MYGNTTFHISLFPWEAVSKQVVRPRLCTCLKMLLTNLSCNRGSPPDNVMPPPCGRCHSWYLLTNEVTSPEDIANSGCFSGLTYLESLGCSNIDNALDTPEERMSYKFLVRRLLRMSPARTRYLQCLHPSPLLNWHPQATWCDILSFCQQWLPEQWEQR